MIGSRDLRECFEPIGEEGLHLAQGGLVVARERRNVGASTRVFEATIGEAFGLAQEPLERATELQTGERGPTEPRALGSAGERAHGPREQGLERGLRIGKAVLGVATGEAHAGERELCQGVEALALAAKGAQETVAHCAGYVTRVERPAHWGSGQRLSMTRASQDTNGKRTAATATCESAKATPKC